jgi:hypothetical protein
LSGIPEEQSPAPEKTASLVDLAHERSADFNFVRVIPDDPDNPLCHR